MRNTSACVKDSTDAGLTAGPRPLRVCRPRLVRPRKPQFLTKRYPRCAHDTGHPGNIYVRHHHPDHRRDRDADFERRAQARESGFGRTSGDQPGRTARAAGRSSQARAADRLCDRCPGAGADARCARLWRLQLSPGPTGISGTHAGAFCHLRPGDDVRHHRACHGRAGGRGADRRHRGIRYSARLRPDRTVRTRLQASGAAVLAARPGAGDTRRTLADAADPMARAQEHGAPLCAHVRHPARHRAGRARAPHRGFRYRPLRHRSDHHAARPPLRLCQEHHAGGYRGTEHRAGTAGAGSGGIRATRLPKPTRPGICPGRFRFAVFAAWLRVPRVTFPILTCP